MAEGQQRNVVLVPGAAQALDQFKYEVAQEISNSGDPQAQLLQQWLSGATGGYGGDIPSRVWGAVGGHMVRRMIAAAEQSLIQQATAEVQTAFRQGMQQQQQFQAQPQGFAGTPNPRTIQEQNLHPRDV